MNEFAQNFMNDQTTFLAAVFVGMVVVGLLAGFAFIALGPK